MVLFFKNHTIQIYRHRRKGSANRYGMSATLTAYQADIQPSSIERQQQYEGKVGELYDAFVESSVDIKEGDEVLTEAGTRYSVKGVSSWSGAGMLDSKELLLVTKDADN